MRRGKELFAPPQRRNATAYTIVCLTAPGMRALHLVSECRTPVGRGAVCWDGVPFVVARPNYCQSVRTFDMHSTLGVQAIDGLLTIAMGHNVLLDALMQCPRER